MKIEQIKKEITRMDRRCDLKSREGMAAVVLLSSAFVGTTIKKLKEFTGYNEKFIKEIHRNLVSNKIFVKDKVSCNWLDKKSGGTAFWMDVCVATGLMKRVK